MNASLEYGSVQGEVAFRAHRERKRSMWEIPRANTGTNTARAWIPMIIFGPCINFLLLMVPTSQTLGPKSTGDHHLEDHLKDRGIMQGGPAGKCERLGKTSFCFCNCQRLVSGARRVHPLSPRRAAGYRVNPPERVQG